MGNNKARITAHAADHLVGEPARFDHAVVRWFRRYGRPRGHRLEVVQDRLIAADERRELLQGIVREHGGHSFWAVADLDGDGTDWAVAVQLVVQDEKYVIGEVRVFPAMPATALAPGSFDQVIDCGAAPMPCNACGQLMPQGSIPKGGITDKVFRSAKPVHYRDEALKSLDDEARTFFAGKRAAENIRRRRRMANRKVTPARLLEVVLAVNAAYDRGSRSANVDAGKALRERPEWVRDRLVDAALAGIITNPGKGTRGPRVLTAYGKQLLEERNRQA